MNKIGKSKYTVAQIGCGGRGRIHLDGWIKNSDRCELVAICDLEQTRMEEALKGQKAAPSRYTDADKMLKEMHPDILCFSTPPKIRMELVKLAVKHKVKGLVFEKPMALSLNAASKMTRMCNDNHIKAAVSFQHKYLTSFQKLKEILDKGEIGKVLRIEASCQAGLSLLGSHYIDYALWANGNSKAQWVVGHVHGRELLKDQQHPSPNYVMGRIGFENGVFAIIECGQLSAMYMGKRGLCIDNRLTVYGALGYAWCDTDGGWGLFAPRTGGELLLGKGESWIIQQSQLLQPLFVRDLIAWLDDDSKPHPCNINNSYAGYEIMEAICLSAMDRIRIDLPLKPQKSGQDIFNRMRMELPECHERFGI
ncbi:MAG: Gfo/Idh/MocA family oxidoreductase [Verrucomicrobiae bacterium]|nr:Gfo/Idh/MocA family oxidoreductase [Verrucomicrobiae bacterium]